MGILRHTRGGKHNDPRFGPQMQGEGPYASLLKQRLGRACRQHGLKQGLFRPPRINGLQPGLFDD